MLSQDFKKKCLIVVVTLLAMLGVGSFFDFQISSALYDPNNVYGIFFASFGQVPAMLCWSFGGVILVRLAKDKNIFIKILAFVGCALFNLLALAALTFDPYQYIKVLPIAVCFVIALIIAGVSNYAFYKATENTSKEDLKKLCIVLIGAMLLSNIIVNIVKVPWSRPRMRMIAEQPLASFQPWWVIGCEAREALMALGVASEEFKSFPSGHACCAACMMLLCVLPLVSEKMKGKENILFAIGFGFPLLVALARIIAGAHFLTDVTVGMTVTFIVEFILVYIFWLRKGLSK